MNYRALKSGVKCQLPVAYSNIMVEVNSRCSKFSDSNKLNQTGPVDCMVGLFVLILPFKTTIFGAEHIAEDDVRQTFISISNIQKKIKKK